MTFKPSKELQEARARLIEFFSAHPEPWEDWTPEVIAEHHRLYHAVEALQIPEYRAYNAKPTTRVLH